MILTFFVEFALYIKQIFMANIPAISITGALIALVVAHYQLVKAIREYEDRKRRMW